jgi:paraquat-inducible protein B
MSLKNSKTLIGGFVVGAAALLVASIIVFGSGGFLTHRPTYVLYFERSIFGLTVGAPVVFRGVRIGSVKDIVLIHDVAKLSYQIPVYIELDPKRMQLVTNRPLPDAEPDKHLDLLIQAGLRAQLQMQSLVTGQLMIQLDTYPDKPIRLVRGETRYPEIPTIPSSLDKISKTLRELPVEDLVGQAISVLAGIEKIVNSPDLIESLSILKSGLTDARALVKNIDSRIDPLMTGYQKTEADVHVLLRETRQQVSNVSATLIDAIRTAKQTVKSVQDTYVMDKGEFDGLVASIRGAADSVRNALVEAEKAMVNIGVLTSADSTVIYQINQTLKDLSDAARSIRIWADYLERHPEALIRGKGGARGR